MSFKRNDVVLVGDPTGYRMYGRVNRVVGEDQYEVICCGKHVQTLSSRSLELDNEYEGYVTNSGHLVRMPTLRKLKQMAAFYKPDVWKHKQKRDHRRKRFFEWMKKNEPTDRIGSP